MGKDRKSVPDFALALLSALCGVQDVVTVKPRMEDSRMT